MYDLSTWNNISGANATQPYSIPTSDDIDFANFGADSSGNVPSGISMGNALKAGGSIFSAYGDILAGNQKNDAYKYNAQLALDQEGFAIDKLDKAEVSMLSTQRAMYAKSGVEFTGSPVDVALHTATGFEMDKQITRYNAQSKVNMLRYEGAMAKSQGQINAGMDLLSGAAQLGASAFL